jgi:hypothetical protein
MLKKIISLLIVLLESVGFYGRADAQLPRLDLESAIKIAQEHSLSFKIAKNKYQSSSWNYKNFRIYDLPVLRLEGTLPSYAHSITKITLPNGEDTFVSQNQAFNSLNLNLSQNISATGGVLSIGSSINRIDVLGGIHSVNYSAVPAFISYNQANLSFNEFKWTKKTEPLRYQIAGKEFLSDMENICSETVKFYFDLLSAQSRKILSAQNLCTTDSLLMLAKERFKLGTVTQSELLQLRLSLLNAKKDLAQDSIDVTLSLQKFSRYLNIQMSEVQDLLVPKAVQFFDISSEKATEMARTNSKQILEFRLKKLEAEKSVAQIKSESTMKFNIQANIGLSNAASNITGLFNGFQNQQNITLGFSLPIIDWGDSKIKRLRAEADLSMVENENAQGQMEIEQEIALQVSRWKLLPQQISIAMEAQRISEESYILEKQRFINGSINLNDLNVSQLNKVNSVNALNDIIKNYWEVFYAIRQLTLYDFKTDKKLTNVIEQK